MNSQICHESINALWDDCLVKDEDKVCIVYESKDGQTSQFTYGELYQNIMRASNFFIDLNIRKGDKVAVHMHSSPEFLVIWFALLRIGAVMVPLNCNYTQRECRFILDQCDVQCLLTESDFVSLYEDAFFASVTKILTRSDAPLEGYLNFAECIERQPTELKEKRAVFSDDPAEILFTSGTTSSPKGAIFNHYNLVFAGQFHAEQIGLQHDDRFFTVFPCFHIDWQAIAILPTITQKATIIVQERYSASSFWEKIRRHDATLIEMIPMIVRTTMLQPKVAEEKDHHVRRAYFSLCLSTEEKNAFEERFNVPLFNCYGMTETVVCNVADFKNGEANWPSVGKIYDPFQLRIVDDRNQPVPTLEIGEICIKGERGKTLISGYYKNEEQTNKLYDEDDWMHTGDKGFLDEEGWLYFVDRGANLIKRAGENISASEVENVLTSHEAIEEAAVIGVPDPIRDQAVKAYVKFYPGQELSIQELDDFCSEHLASFKVPSFFEVVDDFPHTCTGKIKKKNLSKSVVCPCRG
ncbi:AMP-binding protein [Pseudodesulfovibrio sp. JC047]|uniref:AMP-binding protein n=1 Tax=Pseudodesulfovibrio sp. JC047 TaxID=2683199 RepID=UPI0013D451C2|nr:AMP-binding protein [Pseudodesulfovibrio sp. JC047]